MIVVNLMYYAQRKSTNRSWREVDITLANLSYPEK